MNTVVSVNVGLQKDVELRGAAVRTAIWKQRVQGRVRASVSRTDRDALAEPASNQVGLRDHPMATLRKQTGNEDERI